MANENQAQHTNSEAAASARLRAFGATPLLQGALPGYGGLLGGGYYAAYGAVGAAMSGAASQVAAAGPYEEPPAKVANRLLTTSNNTHDLQVAERRAAIERVLARDPEHKKYKLSSDGKHFEDVHTHKKYAFESKDHANGVNDLPLEFRKEWEVIHQAVEAGKPRPRNDAASNSRIANRPPPPKVRLPGGHQSVARVAHDNHKNDGHRPPPPRIRVPHSQSPSDSTGQGDGTRVAAHHSRVNAKPAQPGNTAVVNGRAPEQHMGTLYAAAYQVVDFMGSVLPAADMTPSAPHVNATPTMNA